MSNSHHLRIEAAHKKIVNVFSSDYAFTIPPYQRPYAWETEQVEELLNDLLEAMAPQTNADGFYFLGSIVLVKMPAKPDSEVVDGQQRLTTLTILFSVIRDLTEDKVKQADREQYIKQVANEDQDLPETLRLELRKTDRAFFAQHVQERGATGNLPAPSPEHNSAQACILQNARIIRTRLEQMDENQRSKLLQFLLLECYLVVVEVPTQPAARRIFTVLNARGMDLSATDILKADLLERAGSGREVDLSQQWENTELALGRERFSDLFTHIRMIFERKKPHSALETGFPEHVPDFSNAPSEFITRTLQPYADAFSLSRNNAGITERLNQKAADLLRSLDRLDNKDWLPPLLLCLKQYTDGSKSPEDVMDFIFRLERLAYCLFVTRANVNRRMTRYANVLNFLDPRSGGSASFKEFLQIAQDEAFNLFDKLNGDVYLASRVVMPLLLRLEQSSTDGSASYDHPTISVEHVCPQTIGENSQWSEWFPTPDVHNRWVHSLGNLVLLHVRKNSAAQNYAFARKKSEYFASGDASPFTLTNEVREYDAWRPEDIESRQDELLQRFADAWDLKSEFENWKISMTAAEKPLL